MLTNNAKTLETDTTDYLPDSPSNGRKPVSSDNRPNNVLPLERPKHNTGKLKLGESVRLATVDAKPGTVNEAETVEIKSRIEAVLERMKSRAATHELPDSAELAEPSSSSEELERRRAAIIAIAREAEVHSREAADKFREAEARFKEETELRLLAEQRVIQTEERLGLIEEESKQWLETAQAEETRRIEVEKAKAELEARLKQEAKARELAEQSRDEAEDKLKIAERALDSAKKAWKEAEARAQAAEEAARAAESLIYEADAIARKAEDKCQAAETSLQRESELRVLAEQMLKELASASPHLELNFENLGAALSQAGSLTPTARGSNQDQSALEELRAQIEAEQKSRIAAEQSRAAAESKAQELEARLRKADEKFRTTENGYKKVLRKQEEELRAMSEQVVRNNDSGQFTAQGKSEGGEMFLDGAPPDAKTKLKLVSYGVFITLLALALAWLGIAAYQQL
jgi:DNA repair exonuclease SbcCD ATPase subunit